MKVLRILLITLPFLVASIVVINKTNADIPKYIEPAFIPKAAELDTSVMLELVNKERAKVGVAPLKLDTRLVTSAQQKCNDMAQNDYYAHKNPVTGMHGYEYATAALNGSMLVGENINMGRFDTEAEIIQSWMDSAPHRAAILRITNTITGIAVCRTKLGTRMSVQHFAQI